MGDAVVLRLYGEEFAGLHEVIRKRVIYKAVHALTQTAKDIYKVHVNAVDELIGKKGWQQCRYMLWTVCGKRV